MRTGVLRKMAAAIAECIKLLHIAQAQPGLLLDPGMQSDLEGAVRARVERTEGKSGARLSFAAVRRDENRRLVVLGRDDRGGEANLDRWEC